MSFCQVQGFEVKTRLIPGPVIAVEMWRNVFRARWSRQLHLRSSQVQKDLSLQPKIDEKSLRKYWTFTELRKATRLFKTSLKRCWWDETPESRCSFTSNGDGWGEWRPSRRTWELLETPQELLRTPEAVCAGVKGGRTSLQNSYFHVSLNYTHFLSMWMLTRFKVGHMMRTGWLGLVGSVCRWLTGGVPVNPTGVGWDWD